MLWLRRAVVRPRFLTEVVIINYSRDCKYQGLFFRQGFLGPRAIGESWGCNRGIHRSIQVHMVKIHAISDFALRSRLESQVVLSSTLSSFSADRLIVEAANSNSQRQVVSFPKTRCAFCLDLRYGMLSFVGRLHFFALCRWPVHTVQPQVTSLPRNPMVRSES